LFKIKDLVIQWLVFCFQTWENPEKKDKDSKSDRSSRTCWSNNLI